MNVLAKKEDNKLIFTFRLLLFRFLLALINLYLTVSVIHAPGCSYHVIRNINMRSDRELENEE